MTRKFTAFSKVAVAAAVLSVLAPLHAEEMEDQDLHRQFRRNRWNDSTWVTLMN